MSACSLYGGSLVLVARYWSEWSSVRRDLQESQRRAKQAFEPFKTVLEHRTEYSVFMSPYQKSTCERQRMSINQCIEM